MKNLSTEIDWFDQQPMHRSMKLSACICICASEGLIQSQDEPERMRAFLLVAVFLEQFIRSHFEKLHEAFCLDFSVPQLLARGGKGCASPAWLLNHELGYDENLNWSLISELAGDAADEVYDWLSQQYGITADQFRSLLRGDISATFEPRHQAGMIRAFGLSDEHAPNWTTTLSSGLRYLQPGSL